MNPFKCVYSAWAKRGKPMLANPFKRKVTIVYTSTWLAGNYAFTFKAGQRGNIMDAWEDHFISNLRDDMTYADLKAARTNPCIEVIELF